MGRGTTGRPRWLAGLGSALVAVLAVLVWWFAPGGEEPAPEAERPTALTSASPAPDTSPVQERPAIDPLSGLRWIDVEYLPEEAHEVLDLIDRGGPFRYDKDGSTFGNHEGLLPGERRGYYREYTVDTPGLSHRGPRRIVTGAEGEEYWTEDHYESFERIAR